MDGVCKSAIENQAQHPDIAIYVNTEIAKGRRDNKDHASQFSKKLQN